MKTKWKYYKWFFFNKTFIARYKYIKNGQYVEQETYNNDNHKWKKELFPYSVCEYDTLIKNDVDLMKELLK